MAGGLNPTRLHCETSEHPVLSGLVPVMFRQHYSLNPLVGVQVNPMIWPRGRLSVTAPSQVHLDNSTIFDGEERVIGSAGMSEGGQLHFVQGMAGG
jgi:hypothetical protein